ncbi:cAMP-regulated phosphoprotein 21-like isoform X2 [Xenia sp. Carnegie-2017]|uniref:cAMP-regulated phosphoprotein 21-like isoform X2 n=1 Tax=Xenia sp. Carnegie-2017 TaxID=2897299 RepID=UPI001F0364F8|nr:cAMP-regulated phosphoprotein 21-like isoform X2 [Xenia sp. Carnegie-2017]
MDEKDIQYKDTKSDVGEIIKEDSDTGLNLYKENNVNCTCTSSPAQKNTVHVQHAHSFQTSVVATTVLPRVLSEQSKLRILTRAPAVQSMSSNLSEESVEDVAIESETTHQPSSKDTDSESGPSSLSSSRESSLDYTDSTGTDLNEFIIKTLKNPRDKKLLLKLEKDFIGFISDPLKVLLQYPPMTSYHRMIVHRVAAYFGLDHNVDPTGKCIIVNKCTNTRFPEHRFIDLVHEDSEEDPSPKLILKRQQSLSDDSGLHERRSTHSRRSMEGRKSKSIEEREEEYKKARSRIFNHGSLSSQSSASSKDGESALSGTTDIDDEPEKTHDFFDAEKTTEVSKTAVRVLTNRARTPEDNPKLTLEVSSISEANTCQATPGTTVTESGNYSSTNRRSADCTNFSPEGTSNVPRGNIEETTRTRYMEMIPQISPNQTGGVVWTIPPNQVSFQQGQVPIYQTNENQGPQVVKPESYTLGAQQAIAAPTFYFANNHGAGVAMVSQPSQRQENNGQQLPHKTYPTQAVPLPPQFVNPTSFPVYQSPRVYTQQDLDMLPCQQKNTTSVQGGSATSYQEISNQFSGIAINHIEPENPTLSKQAGFSSNSSQAFPSSKAMHFVVYRNVPGTMVMNSAANPSPVNSAYVYPSQSPNTYTQQGYTPQVYTHVYPASPNFNQGYHLGEQTMLSHGNSTCTPPTPSQGGPTLNANPPYIHAQTVPVTTASVKMTNQVVNPGLLPPRLMNPYGIQGQQVIQIPARPQLYGLTQVPFTPDQNRTNLSQSNRYVAFSENAAANDIYTPDSRRQSSNDYLSRSTMSSSQTRRSGAASSRSKNDAQRNQHHHAGKSRQKHKRSQQKHSVDVCRKQYHSGSFPSGSSSSELDQATQSGRSSCVLEVYDVNLNSRDQHEVEEDLLQAGAKISWDENISKHSGKTLTAKATFSSDEQAEQALLKNSNQNYKLRRCSNDIPYS